MMEYYVRYGNKLQEMTLNAKLDPSTRSLLHIDMDSKMYQIFDDLYSLNKLVYVSVIVVTNIVYKGFCI